MTHNSDKPAFYVVQFLDLPYEGIDDYVCIPHTWVMVRRVGKHGKAVVTYPTGEDPTLTRVRVKKKEKCNNEWKFYMAAVKYQSNSYQNAETWIASRNDRRLLLERETRKMHDTEPESTLNPNSRNSTQDNSSKLNDNPRKPLPKTLIKRPTLPELNEQLDGKRFTLKKAAKPSSASVPDANTELKREQSTSIQDNQSTKLAQTQETAAVSNINSRTEQRTQTQRTEENREALTKNVVVSTKSDKHQHLIDNAHQTDECVVKPLSPHYAVTSDSDTVTDEGISDHELSTNRAPVDRINDSTITEISSASSSADTPSSAQNSNSTSISSSTDVKSTLEQEMLDNFAILFTQMGSTLRYTTDMYNTLRSSILNTAQIYKKLLGAVEQFNSMQNSAGNKSFLINLKPEVQKSPKRIHTEVTTNTSSSIQDHHSNNDANEPPKRKRNSWRFVLPSEYDPHDTKWTLKYRTNLPGLVELRPQSGVYVSYGDLKYCQHVSKDCKSLAGRLLSAVFNRKALSVCLLMTERAQASDNVRSNARPELDDHACWVLLNFVLEHGLQRGWNTDLQPIFNTLHRKIQKIRFKYGVVVEC